jgi:hypothetical protein
MLATLQFEPSLSVAWINKLNKNKINKIYIWTEGMDIPLTTQQNTI